MEAQQGLMLDASGGLVAESLPRREDSGALPWQDQRLEFRRRIRTTMPVSHPVGTRASPHTAETPIQPANTRPERLLARDTTAAPLKGSAPSRDLLKARQRGHLLAQPPFIRTTWS
jgi:hypothetical protein